MVTVTLKFPGRRYHATPWGHHVNEGQVEWPPAPWRLLRALLATGYSKLGWTAPPPEAKSLVEKLATLLPSYELPAASGAHSRHYMPLGILDKGREKTTLVFDTWAQVDDGAVSISWPVELTEPERRLLGDLVARLGYLGRSESWVDGTVVDSSEGLVQNAFPCDGAKHPGPGWEQVALLAPETPEATREFLASQQPPPQKSKPKKKAKAGPALPTDLLGCLQLETNYLQAQGWSQPPGSRRVLYWRRANSLEAARPATSAASQEGPAVPAMLLAFATPSGNVHALPPITRTLPQGELLHRALVAHGAPREVPGLEVLTGLDAAGKPLTGHRHLHLLHLDLDGDGHLDHVLLWANAGLSAALQATVRSVRSTYAKGVPGHLPLVLAWSGALADVCNLPPPWGDSLQRVVGASQRWASRTPFVAPRFLKRRGKNDLLGQVQAELESRGLPKAEVEVIDPREDAALRLRHFVRVRRNGPPPPVDCGYHLRLRFSSPVKGPLCLGYGAHFGLGRFEAEE